jgi:hypothetical protein
MLCTLVVTDGTFFTMRLSTSEVDNFSLKMSWNILKYTGTIYSTRSPQIRVVFEVKVIRFRAGCANSHLCCGTVWEFGKPRFRSKFVISNLLKFWSVTVCTSTAEIYHFHFKNSPDLKRSRRVDGPSIFLNISAHLQWQIIDLWCWESHFEKCAIRHHERA